QLVLDAIRFLLALAAPASLVALVLAGIALRREGTTSFSVGGGGFSKWMFWAIVMITLPQVFGWFAFWGVGAALPGGGIGNGWMSGFANDAVIFVNTLVIGRLVPVLAAWMVLRSVIDFSEGYTPLASILGAMFLLAIPATAALLQGWNDGTRFGTAAVLEGAWTYTASRIMPIAAALVFALGVLRFAHGQAHTYTPWAGFLCLMVSGVLRGIEKFAAQASWNNPDLVWITLRGLVNWTCNVFLPVYAVLQLI